MGRPTVLAGWVFGNIPLVGENFEVVVIGIFALPIFSLAGKALLSWQRAVLFFRKSLPEVQTAGSTATRDSEK
ncbi:MAG: hypothetical protein JMM79_01865 [Candidatus Xiphinematobacter sp.]|nr:MAG: hypothetical protein JMM79_01865 [Candidatus Xiphinematobacter sp.]